MITEDDWMGVKPEVLSMTCATIVTDPVVRPYRMQVRWMVYTECKKGV